MNKILCFIFALNCANCAAITTPTCTDFSSIDDSEDNDKEDIEAEKTKWKNNKHREAVWKRNSEQHVVHYNGKAYRLSENFIHPHEKEFENIVRLRKEAITVVEAKDHESTDPNICRKMVSTDTVDQQRKIDLNKVKYRYKTKDRSLLCIMEECKGNIMPFLYKLDSKFLSFKEKAELLSFILALGSTGIIGDETIRSFSLPIRSAAKDVGKARPFGFNDDLKESILRLISDEAANDLPPIR